MLKNEKTPEADAKLENLKELKASMKSYTSLNDFLENNSLQTAIDEKNDKLTDENKIQITNTENSKEIKAEPKLN